MNESADSTESIVQLCAEQIQCFRKAMLGVLNWYHFVTVLARNVTETAVEGETLMVSLDAGTTNLDMKAFQYLCSIELHSGLVFARDVTCKQNDAPPLSL